MIKWNNKEKFYVFCQMAKTLMFNQRAIKTGIKNNRVVLKRNYLNFDNISFLFFYEQDMLKIDPLFKLRNF